MVEARHEIKKRFIGFICLPSQMQETYTPFTGRSLVCLRIADLCFALRYYVMKLKLLICLQLYIQTGFPLRKNFTPVIISVVSWRTWSAEYIEDNPPAMPVRIHQVLQYFQSAVVEKVPICTYAYLIFPMTWSIIL